MFSYLTCGFAGFALIALGCVTLGSAVLIGAGVLVAVSKAK